MEITREQFERECKRRFGAANPERMRIGYWEWMVRRGGGPYGVRKELGLASNSHRCGEGACSLADPDWCFERFGMTRTRMGDGRIICIAGEHEDSYDPDFCIYNDVVVLRPAAGEEWVTPSSGEVEIYGYPEGVFPPTDFHSATPVGERIYVIGRLGYRGTRRAGETPVYAVDTRGYAVEEVRATGPRPGWIYGHHAWYDAARHAITLRGGKVHDAGAERRDPEHLGAHRLYLEDMRWEVISVAERRRRFIIECDETGDDFTELREGAFRPAGVAHEVLETEHGGVPTYGISVEGVRVTFKEFYDEIQVTVEGALPEEVVERIVGEVRGNLGRETRAEWGVREVEDFEEV